MIQPENLTTSIENVEGHSRRYWKNV